MKLGKRILAGVLSAAVFVSACISGNLTAFADDADGDLTEKSVLTVKGDALISNSSEHVGETYNGYLQTVNATNTDYIESKYLSVKYSVDGEAADNTDVFNFQPFDTSWGGWDDNIITIGDSTYDESSKTYTAKIPTQKVIQSLSTGGTINGINLSFCQAEPAVTLIDYTILTEKNIDTTNEADRQLETPIDLFYITGSELREAGVDVDAIAEVDAQATIYIHITKADPYSWLRASAGGVTGGSSNRILKGSKATMTKSDSAYYIQDSENNDGVGLAGTANYKFPNCATNKAADGDDLQVAVRIWTTETEAQMLGVVFSNGESFKVKEDGTVEKGFEPPVCENTELDTPSDVISEVWQYTAEMQKDNLKLTLDYIAKMDSSLYTEESWKALQDALPAAQAVYDNAAATAEELKTARDKIENVKANLIFKNTLSDDSSAMPYRELTPEQLIAEMGVGINLGNTMDGHSGFTPSETSWQSVVTTKEYITALHDAGYNTVRIPVTWGTMIDDENGFAIKESWINRVREIVDYCVEQDMYAIINIHHDGAEQTGWLRVAADDIDAVMNKFENVWRNIALAFKDYDEHLIFESMNEISCSEKNKNSSEAVEYDTPIIVNFNQLFVNTVRATGSNNAKRWLAAVSHYANNGTNKAFTLPTDSYNENAKIMFALHIYSDEQGIADRLKALAAKFKGIPMYLGEYGSTVAVDANDPSGYNDGTRGHKEEVTAKMCLAAGVCPIAWDQGYGTEGKYQTGLYTYWDREDCVSLHPATTQATIRGYYTALSELNKNFDFSDIAYNPAITPITSIDVVDSVEMTIGDIKNVTAATAPADTNDVVLFSTDNDDVVTVFNGMIRAKGIGTTTVHVYSQNGEVKKEIKVTVNAKETEDNVKITTDKALYQVVEGGSVAIKAEASNGEGLTYVSTNEEICTVNSQGVVYAHKVGSAQIVITSESGVTKTVTVSVTDSLVTGEVSLGLVVHYNDNINNYWSAEMGEVIKVTENGQYTVKFDCSKDLSSAAKNAGITSIANLTAIYIKDQAVLNGDATETPLLSADITWDKVVVDGKEMTITKPGPKSALKSGVFDTGDPVNAWDGSAIEGVTADGNHVANFDAGPAQTMEVTFTLTNVEFKASATGNEKPAESVEPDVEGGNKITIAADDDTMVIPIAVKVSPADTDSTITFVSSDRSVAVLTEASEARAAVLGDGFVTVTPDKDGYARCVVNMLERKDVTITAISDNGVSTNIKIVFEKAQEPDDNKGDVTTDDDNKGDVTNDNNSNITDNNNNGANTDNTNSPPTGVAIAFIPLVLAASAAAVLHVTKKSK